MGWFSFVAGVLLSQGFTVFPPPVACAVIAGAAMCASLLTGRPARPAPAWLKVWLLGIAGLAYGAWQLQLQKELQLPEAVLQKTVKAQLLVVGLPRRLPAGQQVDALLDLPGQPTVRVQSIWPPGHPTLDVGSRWQAELRLSAVRGLANFHGFDRERLAWSRGWQARAMVRSSRRLPSGAAGRSLETWVNAGRDRWRHSMQEALVGQRWGAVLIALALGDQAGVRQEDWRLFRETGITHLISISGIHVTMLAMMVACAVSWSWRRLRWRGLSLAESWPAQWVAGGVGLGIAAAYCLLAGWGVPAQRTWFMLAIMVAGQWGQYSLTFWQRWIRAAACILLLDPSSTLAVGFWLSFGAVAILLWSGVGRWRKRDEGRGARWSRSAGKAVYFQLAVTLGMLPLGILFFNQVSWISPVANAVAIPVMTWLITPLSLAALCLSMAGASPGWTGWLLQAAHAVCEAQMRVMTALAALPGASMDWHRPHPLGVAAALLGAVFVLAPRGGVPKRWGLFLMLGLLIPAAARLERGEWELTALDIGQGSALVLRYQGGALVFDTGPSSRGGWSAAEQVLLPHLAGEGVKRLDALVVSHEDLDHASGIGLLEQSVPINRGFSSFPVDSAVVSWARCEGGMQWRAGGMRFRFLAPDAALLARYGQPGDSANARSCVLEVEGAHHRLVLTGDIGREQENALVAGGISGADVVVAAHHGSRTSSSAAWVRRMAPSIVIVQAGYRNRYGHPHAVVVDRWRASGAKLLRTDLHGAVRVYSSRQGLAHAALRRDHRRYWRAKASEE